MLKCVYLTLPDPASTVEAREGLGMRDSKIFLPKPHNFDWLLCADSFVNRYENQYLDAPWSDDDLC